MSSETSPKPKVTGETEVQYVRGVGPARADALASVDVRTVHDLLYYFPRRYLDRSTISTISRLKVDQEATVVGRVAVKGIRKGRRRQ